jgi:hypothetical protein
MGVLRIRDVTAAMSPKTHSRQSRSEIGKRSHIDLRLTKRHPRAGHRVQHPRRHQHHHAGANLDQNKLTISTAQTMKTANLTPEKRVPSILDRYVLSDMGRMNANWPLAASRGCSRVRSVAPSGPRPWSH